jgi:hypothetical protein
MSTILIKRQGKKKMSVFKCRKGSHEFTQLGELVRENETHVYSWCTTCGCLQETTTTTDEEGTLLSGSAVIMMPDTGI